MGVVPMRACGGKSCKAAAGQLIMFALHQEFGFGERVVIARMVHIEVSTNDHIDIFGAPTNTSEVLKDVLHVLCWRYVGRPWNVRREAGVDQNVMPLGSFN